MIQKDGLRCHRPRIGCHARIANGFLAVMVMALYVNSQEVRILYQYPTLLLLICPMLLYW